MVYVGLMTTTTTIPCMTRSQPATGRRHACSWQHYLSVLEYRIAREAAEAQRDEAVGIYGSDSPEWAEYTAAANMITFKSWLINMGGQR